MRTIGNLIWHIPFLGFLTALLSFIIGGLLILTVVASPIGLGLVEYGKFLLMPFGQRMIDRRDLNRPVNPVWRVYSSIIRILYFPFGLVLTIVALCQIIPLFCTVIGIPVAIIVANSLSTFFNPVNKVCVPEELDNALRQRRAFEKYQRN